MRYTLEIQKLLLQTQNNNLHPREKANLLKEAIRIADENEDVEWATELRLDLIYELNLLSADAEEITVFSKILDDYENHKDVIKEDDLLWKYKWIWACKLLKNRPIFSIFRRFRWNRCRQSGRIIKPVSSGTDILCGVIFTAGLWNVSGCGSMTRRKNTLIKC